MIDWAQMSRKEDRDAEALASARAEALTSLRVELDRQADLIVGEVPEVERHSWGAKDAAARGYKSLGQGSPAHDIAMLAQEAHFRGKGESVDQLCDKIIGNADAYRQIVAAFSAIRTRATDAIMAAPSVEAVNAILELASSAIASVAEH